MFLCEIEFTSIFLYKLVNSIRRLNKKGENQNDNLQQPKAAITKRKFERLQ